MQPSAPYNAKPAPIHRGDWDGAGFSTVFLTSAGYAELVGEATPTPAAAQLASPAPLPRTWIATSGAGVLLLVAAALFLDGRIKL